MSRVRRDHPRCRNATYFCIDSTCLDVAMYSNIHRNPFRGFWAMGVENLHPSALVRLVAFTAAYTTV